MQTNKRKPYQHLRTSMQCIKETVHANIMKPYSEKRIHTHTYLTTNQTIIHQLRKPYKTLRTPYTQLKKPYTQLRNHTNSLEDLTNTKLDNHTHKCEIHTQTLRTPYKQFRKPCTQMLKTKTHSLNRTLTQNENTIQTNTAKQYKTI